MIELIGRMQRETMEPKANATLLSLAVEHQVDWGFSCKNGVCARCRCLVKQGMEKLSQPTQAELARLELEEIEQGYRLACQTRLVQKESDSADSEPIVVIHKPYY